MIGPIPQTRALRSLGQQTVTELGLEVRQSWSGALCPPSLHTHCVLFATKRLPMRKYMQPFQQYWVLNWNGSMCYCFWRKWLQPGLLSPANEAGGEDIFRYFRLRTVTSFISFVRKLLEDENNKKWWELPGGQQDDLVWRKMTDGSRWERGTLRNYQHDWKLENTWG